MNESKRPKGEAIGRIGLILIIFAVVVAATVFWNLERGQGHGAPASVDMATLEALLPNGAEVVEQIGMPAQEPRVVVLWMMNPETIETAPDPRNCPDMAMGTRLKGRTRISLIDAGGLRIINTLSIRDPADERFDSFEIPILASTDGYYTVPKTDQSGLGRPRILNLKDYTGEGTAGQFPLFAYEDCSESGGTMVGYSQRLDRVVQYPVTSLGGGKSGEDVTTHWTTNVFGSQPLQAGHWNHSYQPGHGFDGTIHVDVAFDRLHQRYIEKDIVTPE